MLYIAERITLKIFLFQPVADQAILLPGEEGEKLRTWPESDRTFGTVENQYSLASMEKFKVNQFN